MIRNESSEHHTMTLLIEVTQQILKLDFDEDEAPVRLEELQSAQERLRDRIEELWSPSLRNDAVFQEMIRQAYDAEMEVNQRLKAVRLEVSSHLNKIHEGSRIKNAYDQEYSQSEGYFVDRKK